MFNTCCVILFTALVMCHGGSVPGFDIGDAEYYVSGNLQIGSSSGASLSSSLAVSKTRQAAVWNITNSVYYIYSNISYVIFYSGIGGSNSSICFYRDDYNFTTFRTEYGRLRPFFDDIIPYYFGAPKDVGSSCEMISVMVQRAIGSNRIRRMLFSQYFPAISESLGTDDPDLTRMTCSLDYPVINARLPNNSDFTPPEACTNPNPIMKDYTEFWYRRFSFCDPQQNIGVPLKIQPLAF